MSEESEHIEPDEDEGGQRIAGKKLALILALLILIILAAVIGVVFSGVLDPLLGTQEQALETETQPKPDLMAPGTYFDLDDILVTLRTSGRKQKFLKLQITFELAKTADETRIENVKPRIIDSYQVFLRELRLEELEGGDGMERIRNELLRLANKAAYPVKIKDVLFKDMLIQ